MAKYFSFNINPAITAAIQRLCSGRSKYDCLIGSYRSKTLEECVENRNLPSSTPKTVILTPIIGRGEMSEVQETTV